MTHDELVKALLVERYTVLPELRRVAPAFRGWTETQQAQHLADLNADLDEVAKTKPLILADCDGDIDQVAVDRFCHGDNVQLTALERKAAARRMVAAGHTKTRTANRLGVSTTTLTRWLTAA